MPEYMASDPLGLNRVEPRTLGGQVAGDQPHALAGLLDLPVVLAHPRAHALAVVPGGVVPDQQHGALAALLGTRRAPAQEGDGDRADGTPLDEAQPQILAAAGPGVPAARQQAIAGQRLGSGVVARDRLPEQAQ